MATQQLFSRAPQASIAPSSSKDNQAKATDALVKIYTEGNPLAPKPAPAPNTPTITKFIGGGSGGSGASSSPAPAPTPSQPIASGFGTTTSQPIASGFGTTPITTPSQMPVQSKSTLGFNAIQNPYGTQTYSDYQYKVLSETPTYARPGLPYAGYVPYLGMQQTRDFNINPQSNTRSDIIPQVSSRTTLDRGYPSTTSRDLTISQIKRFYAQPKAGQFSGTLYKESPKGKRDNRDYNFELVAPTPALNKLGNFGADLGKQISSITGDNPLTPVGQVAANFLPQYKSEIAKQETNVISTAAVIASTPLVYGGAIVSDIFPKQKISYTSSGEMFVYREKSSLEKPGGIEAIATNIGIFGIASKLPEFKISSAAQGIIPAYEVSGKSVLFGGSQLALGAYNYLQAPPERKNDVLGSAIGTTIGFALAPSIEKSRITSQPLQSYSDARLNLNVQQISEQGALLTGELRGATNVITPLGSKVSSGFSSSMGGVEVFVNPKGEGIYTVRGLTTLETTTSLKPGTGTLYGEVQPTSVEGVLGKLNVATVKSLNEVTKFGMKEVPYGLSQTTASSPVNVLTEKISDLPSQLSTTFTTGKLVGNIKAPTYETNIYKQTSITGGEGFTALGEGRLTVRTFTGKSSYGEKPIDLFENFLGTPKSKPVIFPSGDNAIKFYGEPVKSPFNYPASPKISPTPIRDLGINPDFPKGSYYIPKEPIAQNAPKGKAYAQQLYDKPLSLEESTLQLPKQLMESISKIQVNSGGAAVSNAAQLQTLEASSYASSVKSVFPNNIFGSTINAAPFISLNKNRQVQSPLIGLTESSTQALKPQATGNFANLIQPIKFIETQRQQPAQRVGESLDSGLRSITRSTFSETGQVPPFVPFSSASNFTFGFGGIRLPGLPDVPRGGSEGRRGKGRGSRKPLYYIPDLAGLFSGRTVSKIPKRFTGVEVKYPVVPKIFRSKTKRGKR